MTTSIINRVYPRACGGTSMVMQYGGEQYGLSPRLRGNHLILAGEGTRRRSIPAPAGEPIWAFLIKIGHGVYPRACGGTGPPSPQCARRGGLSPRLRGNRVPIGGAVRRGGSIPAPAGEPKPALPALPGPQVYPRACGGTPRVPVISTTGHGLSPRLRGNRQSGRPKKACAGSIPAPAGEPPAPQ